MAKGKATGRNTLPRVSSPEGIEARVEQRLKAFKPTAKGHHKPGSRNPRKVDR